MDQYGDAPLLYPRGRGSCFSSRDLDGPAVWSRAADQELQLRRREGGATAGRGLSGLRNQKERSWPRGAPSGSAP